MLLKSPMAAEEGLALSAAVKLVCPRECRALLLRQADGRWDLPGGHLETGEGLEEALAREVREELGLALPPVRLLGEWLYVRPQRRARLVTFYRLRYEAAFDIADLRLSPEHRDAAWFGIDSLDDLDMPVGYRNAVRSVLSFVA